MKRVGITPDGDTIVSFTTAEIGMFCTCSVLLNGLEGLMAENEAHHRQQEQPKASVPYRSHRKMMKRVDRELAKQNAKAKVRKTVRSKPRKSVIAGSQVSCLVCGNTFTAMRSDSRFCSKTCGKKYHNAHRNDKAATPAEPATQATHPCAACREPAPEGQRLCDKCEESAAGMRKRISQTTTGGGL